MHTPRYERTPILPILPANVASSDHHCPCPATHQYPLPLLEFSDSPGIKTEENDMEIFV